MRRAPGMLPIGRCTTYDPNHDRKAGTGPEIAGREGHAGKALAYGARLMLRLDALAAFTEVPGQLTRRYLTSAHVAAMGQVQAWMEEAGMSVRVRSPLQRLWPL